MSFDIVNFVGSQQQHFVTALSDQKIKWNQEAQFAIQAFQKNNYLAGVAAKNPASAQNAIINVAAVGVTLNPVSKLAYLVPRDGGVYLDISYMGLLDIAQSSGSIMWGQCKVVYSNDNYESTGIDTPPIHKSNTFGERGEPVGAYCVVKTKDGSYLTEEMSKADIHAIRDRSPAWKSGKASPWSTDELEMWRKTVVKRASKYWPKSSRLDIAIDHLNVTGGEGIEIVNEQQPEKIVNPIASIEASIQKQGKDWNMFFGWASKVLKRDVTCCDDLSDDELQYFSRKLEAVK